MYAIWAENSQTWFTYGGKILLHNDPAELAYLFPRLKDKIQKVTFPIGRPWMLFTDHPQWVSKLDLIQEGRKQWLDQMRP